MGVLWIGNEADCYLIATSNQTENAGIVDAGYTRSGMRVSRSDSGVLTSTPDWTAVDDLWHKFKYDMTGGITTGFAIWSARNASGQIVAQLVTAAGNTAQFQIWNGATFTNVGAAFGVGLGIVRFDIHFKGGASGEVQIYYGAVGSQTKVLDATGAWASAVAMVRVSHQGTLTGGGFDTYVANEIVQTTSTLSTTCESKFPTSNGTDTDGTGAYTDVDEAMPYSDVDVVTLSTAGQHKSFKGAARTLTQAVVTGVTASCRAWYEVGGPTKLKPYLLIGGTRYYGTTFNLDVLAKGYQYTWELNPATGAAFTGAEANAATLEWGWEAVA